MRNRYIGTDLSKYVETEDASRVEVEPFRRDDVQGNRAGGFTVFEGGPKYTIAFRQAVGRAFVENMAAKFGGEVTWGLRQENQQQ